ncbi:hypothetical protein WICMUC_002529 [Wickerhamomyces mucosus]|uniref:Dynactin subunit 5 n=1 Tax=Wickerhamomyces mucosus TaxID=1378264 RepID=A0A9P8PP69_9ASCO|nr:hypothetical protein WICMUC_002529 [Wickerhamomyces mucosus]
MDSFVETASGNRISKEALIKGPSNILISGNSTISSKVTLNGDVPLVPSETNSTIQIGKFVFIDENVAITPPLYSKNLHKLSKIGSYVQIGKDSEINSLHIGNRVLIEDHCVLQKLTTIHDCVIIKQNTHILESTTIPPFSLVYTKNNKLIIKSLPESFKILNEEASKMAYINSQFTPSDTP